jgi:hypothetical protein
LGNNDPWPLSVKKEVKTKKHFAILRVTVLHKVNSSLDIRPSPTNQVLVRRSFEVLLRCLKDRRPGCFVNEGCCPYALVSWRIGNQLFLCERIALGIGELLCWGVGGELSGVPPWRSWCSGSLRKMLWHCCVWMLKPWLLIWRIGRLKSGLGLLTVTPHHTFAHLRDYLTPSSEFVCSPVNSPWSLSTGCIYIFRCILAKNCIPEAFSCLKFAKARTTLLVG